LKKSELSVWDIIQNWMPNGIWIGIEEVYRIVERYANLDIEDYEPQSPGSNIPKWKRNVRNVLQYRKRTGDIQWNEDAKYLLPLKSDISGSKQFPKSGLVKEEFENQLNRIKDTEKDAIIKQRIGQNVLRNIILEEYKNKCAMCNIDLPELLRVSHIIPWSEDTAIRLDPKNTLLLCGLHDLAFENGLITISNDYKIHLPNNPEGVSIVLKKITLDTLRLPLSDECKPNQEYFIRHRLKHLKFI
jgi:hypothetical protein